MDHDAIIKKTKLTKDKSRQEVNVDENRKLQDSSNSGGSNPAESIVVELVPG